MYAVTTAALELRNFSVISATAVTFSAFAMSLGLLPGDEDRSGAREGAWAKRNAPAQAHGA
ncbi:hypothetical protein GCM10010315_26100 [Streptomyces luteosporeus]|uniref:Uncharacterized protein n=1 Tax=Streptomyces luteosporeus TaxID=173856 RepID=A0ABP6G760_9ACTN